MELRKKQTRKSENQNSTIYNHTLHYRYRWNIRMILVQLLILLGFFLLAEKYFAADEQSMMRSLGFLVILWLMQGISFFLYCFVSSLSMRWHIDAFFSPWGGWRTKLPIEISDYQQIEWVFFFFGLAAGIALAAWSEPLYGLLLLAFHITLSIPRLFTVFRVQKWKKAKKHYVIKHERQGIGLYSTNG
ncbi:hypothetical protein JQN58_10340 [Aneurinibacillus sp. BA2021]|nr:hypothetical protein [Aneurinibacillus sp. BA2021]